ncbi:curli production assembly/transport component CsgG [Thermosulfidibacter takaii ABI70S6]|uniref:Curli production assembly/transport component CsgG n=1 Tax=Thermosulfidibacter takaii (strain DSM 17441 / JCM 13301 / NBRC 103674 / ABI70S6) TaxID=1298851 RepID=A0A0S3QTY7_THET7|nr:CsgG/HfaB family protein [Thermosulfidibacter takaii]BAT71792.1 curli production assembly/transport component CsgG [Thermosulfidibacter takaii ABI70S6]
MKNFKLLSVILLVFAVGCSGSFSTAISPRAKSGPEYVTSVHKSLVSLPKPETSIPVAVYKFRDQTGQYKPHPTAANFSTAVTQGATSILIKALEDSGWFIPLEREALANLLQERKIIRQTRHMYLSEKQRQQIEPLPPLLYAGVIIEGGIIGYDTDVASGGFGAKYFGLGGSTQYRIDRVTIYLRVVSVKTGAVLKTVQTTKVILSNEVSAGLFRYVRLNRLLEIETGVATNEPVEMAVQEAIEKAVHDIIIEGVKMKLWKPQNPKKFALTIEEYDKEIKVLPNFPLTPVEKREQFSESASDI